MTINDVIGYLEFMRDNEHKKADSIVQCDNEIALSIAIDSLGKSEPRKYSDDECDRVIEGLYDISNKLSCHYHVETMKPLLRMIDKAVAIIDEYRKG